MMDREDLGHIDSIKNANYFFKWQKFLSASGLPFMTRLSVIKD